MLVTTAAGVAAAATVVGAGAAVYGASKSGGSSSSPAAAADPFASQRPQYQTQLNTLMSDPSSVTSTPGYQFQLQQGLTGTQRTAAAGGMLNSGNTLAALTQYGQNYASTSYEQQFSNLAQLSGANIGNPGTAGQLQQQQNASSAAAWGQLGQAAIKGASSIWGPQSQSPTATGDNAFSSPVGDAPTSTTF